MTTTNDDDREMAIANNAGPTYRAIAGAFGRLAALKWWVYSVFSRGDR